MKESKKNLSKKIATIFALWAVLPITAFAADTNEDATDLANMEDMLITAERIPTNRWDTPANIAIITAKEIEENHYQDLAEALSHVNGVALGFEFAYFAYLNGSRDTVFLLDGQRIPRGEGFDGTTIDLHYIPSMKMIERIEIVKGGGSALYGSEAVGGVINIITKKGVRDETTLDVKTGSWNKRGIELSNQGTNGKLSWFVVAGVNGSNPYNYANHDLLLYDNQAMREDYKDVLGSLRADYRFTDRNSITFKIMNRTRSYDYYNDNLAVLRKNNRRIYNNMSLTYNFKEKTSTPGFFRIFNTDKTNYFEELGYSRYLLQYASDQYARTWGIDYQNGWQFGDNHKFILGLSWLQSRHSNGLGGIGSDFMKKFMDDFLNPLKYDKLVTNTAVYIQDTISIGDKWSLIPGIRYDHHSNYGNHWSPKVAVNYRASEKTKLYASWGRIFKAPTIAQLYDSDVGNVNLKPESGHTESIGFEHAFDEKTSLSTGVFYSSTDGNVALFSGTGKLTNIPVDVTNKGIEVEFRKKIDDKWSYNLGYSHTTMSRVTANSFYPQPNGYRVGLRYNCGPWKANLLGVMASSINNTYTRSSDAGYYDTVYGPRRYALFDFNISYDASDNTTIYFKTLNFTNQDYAYGNTYSSTPEGRFFQIGATYKF